MVAAAGRRRAGGTGGAGNRAPLPWFIALFLLASLVRSLVPALAPHAGEVKLVAVSGFAAALYLIGSGISRATLAAVGARPLLQGVLLWLFMSAAALAAARATG